MPDPPTPEPSPDPVIEQGPEWLFELFTHPPGWVNPVLKLAALVTLVVVGYRLYQWDGELPVEVQREMQIVAGHIIATTTATLAFVNLTTHGYLVDVTLGVTTGYGVVLALQSSRVAQILRVPEHPVERGAVVWVAVALGALVGPPVAMTRGIGLPITNSRYLLAGIAVALLLYNAMRLQETTAST